MYENYHVVCIFAIKKNNYNFIDEVHIIYTFKITQTEVKLNLTYFKFVFININKNNKYGFHKHLTS